MAKENPQEKRPVGSIFREAREAKRLSYEVVHEATKIPMDVLKAIEEGYTIRTMSLFYLKAFKKKYAEYLDINIADVVEDYRPETLPKPIRDDSYELLQKRLKMIFTRDRQQQIVKVVGAIIVLLFLVKIVGCLVGGAKDRGEKAAKVSRETKSSIPKVEPKPVAAVKPAAPVPVSRPASAPAQEEAAQAPSVNSQLVNLFVKARKTCWLRVKVDGNLVFQATLLEGASEAWHADKEIEISGKNIHGLDFELNGKVLPGLGRSERDARRVVVTRKGLSVRQ